MNKQKWVPFDIDITKNRGKRERSPKYQHQREKNNEGNSFYVYAFDYLLDMLSIISSDRVSE